jgi:hypothetical protein
MWCSDSAIDLRALGAVNAGVKRAADHISPSIPFSVPDSVASAIASSAATRGYPAERVGTDLRADPLAVGIAIPGHRPDRAW